VKRWAPPLLALLAACALRDPRVSAASCESNGQCSRDNVCFLGECRPPATNLSVVRVEVRPPSGSAFAAKSLAVDVGHSVLNDFSLLPPLEVGPDGGVPGTVTQAQAAGPATAVAGATVTFSDHAPVIPDRVEKIVATSDATGAYRARLPQGTWDVRVQPPAPLPPFQFGAIDTTSPVTNFIVSPNGNLAQLDGGVTVNGGTGPLAGASVTAIDPGGTAVSAAATTADDGSYSLYLSPTAGSSLALQIGPADAGAGVAAAALDPFPTYQPVSWTPVVDLLLPPAATLSGHVLDSLGNPVPSARVYARSVGGTWTLARSAVADAAGAYSLQLRAGNYLVEAAPTADPGAPALSAQRSITLVASASGIDLTCPPKVRRSGQVLAPDGRPVSANFQVIATRMADTLVTTRSASISLTDATGIYHLVADGGRWRFEVAPPADAVLPHTVAQFDLDPADPGESSLPAIRISPPLQLVGTVRGVKPGVPDMPISGAQVTFFGLDVSGLSFQLGSALADEQGRYEVVVPDVARSFSTTP
jgi:hypothetical protein